MPQFVEWLPQIAIAAIPGAINVWLSSVEQARTLQKYPFFQAWESPRLWWLRIIQFLLPVILFWWLAPAVFEQVPPLCLPQNPPEPDTCQLRPIDISLIGNAIAFGWGFVALLNAPIDILSAGMLPISSIYNFWVEQVCETIYDQQDLKMIDLWQQVESELARIDPLPDKGINLLSEYLGVPSYRLNDNNLDVDTVTVALIQKITRLKDPNLQPNEKARQIVKLLRTEKDLKFTVWQRLIKAFGCREKEIPSLFQANRQPAKK